MCRHGRSISRKDIANEFNKVFSRNSNVNLFSFPSIETIEVNNAIFDLKNRKAVGVDNIKAEIIKQISVYILEHLTYVLFSYFIFR